MKNFSDKKHAEFDSFLLNGDIDAAVEVLKGVLQLHSQPMPKLWFPDNKPPYKNRLAAQYILEEAPRFLQDTKMSKSQIRAIQLQTAEAALLGKMYFDRVSNIPDTLHPKGMKWVMRRLYRYGMDRAEAETRNKLILLGNSGNGGAPSPSELGFQMKLPSVRVPVRFKITFPYILLAVILGLIASYLISQIIFQSLEARFQNQLIEFGKLTADRMVLEEEKRLETLRLISRTEGIAEAVQARDADRLRTLALPIAVNTREDSVDIIDTAGVSVLSMRHTGGGNPEDYLVNQGTEAFRSAEFYRLALQGRDANNRDKYVGVMEAPWGDYFYIAGPIYSEGQVVGVVIVGKSLERLVKEFRADTLAHTTLYDANGVPIVSSLLTLSAETGGLPNDEVARILENPESTSVIRELQIASITYSEIMGPWEARGDVPLGIIGAAQAQNFLVRTNSVTIVQIILFAIIALVIVISVGLLVSRLITRPLLSVVNASAEIAQGNLGVTVQPQGNDEIAVLAHAFNQMVLGLQEVTERRLKEFELVKELEQERELRELKSRFVSMVSHEFRTPLATILSSSEYIQNYGDTVLAEKRAKHFKRIQASINNMTMLLEDILTIGKTESGKLDFNPTPVGVDAFCRDVLDEVQINAGAAHELVFIPMGHCGTFTLDRKLFRQIISNLLSNAVKYSPHGGRIELYLDCRDKALEIRVKDHGIGIPSKDQKHLFEAFHRAANVGNIAGTGLGLLITKMAVELHNGSITFESTEGVGTTFIITMQDMQEALTQDEYMERS